MLKVANIFSDKMVLQRDKNIMVWGLGNDESTVVVTLDGNSAKSTVSDGKWLCVLPPMKAGGEYEMTVTDGANTVVFKEIMIGEVWLCGGQSNMEREIHDTKDGETVLANMKEDCNVRFYYTQKKGFIDEMFYIDENNTGWAKASPENSRAWSAVGYYFGKKLAADLGVTVGLIGCNWGGTSASAWVDRTTLENDKELAWYLETLDNNTKGKTIEEQIEEYHKYEVYDREWNKKSAKIYAETPDIEWSKVCEIIGENKWPGPINMVNPFRPAGLFDTMIMRICPYTIKGFLYYQGESDDHRPDTYYKLLTSLIRLWREKWNDDELPFIIVQLPQFKYANDPDYKHWCKIRNAQLRAYKTVKNTGLAVIYDCGELDNIHPLDKAPVGERLCLQAEKLFYGMNVKADGPMYKSCIYRDGGMELSFDYAENGFEIHGEKPDGFEIAGEDGEFAEADEIEINGSKIFVRNSKIDNPRYVRYDWYNYTIPTIFNETGIPMCPFTTKNEY